jgi:hypothetical protein
MVVRGRVGFWIWTTFFVVLLAAGLVGGLTGWIFVAGHSLVLAFGGLGTALMLHCLVPLTHVGDPDQDRAEPGGTETYGPREEASRTMHDVWCDAATFRAIADNGPGRVWLFEVDTPVAAGDRVLVHEVTTARRRDPVTDELLTSSLPTGLVLRMVIEKVLSPAEAPAFVPPDKATVIVRRVPGPAVMAPPPGTPNLG